MSRLGFYLLCGLLCSCSSVVFSEEKNVQNSVHPTHNDAPATKDVLPILEQTKTDLQSSATNQPIKTSSPTTLIVAGKSENEPSVPSSTTALPITTPDPTTTTTIKPIPPTPKPAPPAPLPPPDQGTWWYTNPDTNKTCIVIQFAAQLNVTYTKSVENKTSLAYALFNVPANATVVEGSCAANDSRQWIVLGWNVADTAMNQMGLYFVRNDTTKNYMLQSLNVTMTAELFPNASSNASIALSHGSLWLTPLATSYRCAPATRVNLTAGAGSAQAASLTVTRLQEEAFRTAPGRGFSAARECGGGDVPDAVPIAVGCALGGLVVVVLVAYLLGRRRSAARGYLSM